MVYLLCYTASCNVGLPLTDDQLQEAAIVSGVLDVPDDFLEPDFRRECERISPNPDETEPKNFSHAYINLKRNISLSNI